MTDSFNKDAQRGQSPLCQHAQWGLSPLCMAELFAKMPLNAEFFVIRRLDMRNRKVDVPHQLVRSEIHCFFYLTQGEALMEIGEQSCCFKANECAAIPAGHAFSARYFDNCTGYMGGFNEEFLNSSSDGRSVRQVFSILRRWGGHKVFFDAQYGQYIEGVLDRLYAEQEGRKNKNIIRSYLATLLTEIEEASRLSRGNPDPLQTENEQCNRFIELVFEYNNHSVPLSEYSDKLNMTKDNLHRIVKQFTGKTPLEWVNEAVILEAKVLLSQTTASVGEVALAVGVGDPSYFSRLFRKHTGTTPLNYRKSRSVRNLQGSS